MTRYISFGVLLCTIILLAILFYKVMAGFLIPLFLAALLVVIFRPIHKWILEKLKGRQKLAALLTTATILFLVLVPLGLLFALATAEGHELITQPNAGKSTLDRVKETRASAGLELPEGIRPIEIHFENLQQLTSPEEIIYHQGELILIRELSEKLVDELKEHDAEKWAKEGVADLWKNYLADLNKLVELHRSASDELDEDKRAIELENYQTQLAGTYKSFKAAKNEYLGKFRALLIDVVNPSEATLRGYTDSIVGLLRSKLLSTGSFVGSFLLGVIIMVLGLYFFLLDGPAMIDSIKGLSPLDDAHEEELVHEFGIVSRALVIATLLSALVQGMLGGIGYYFAGLESVFLLTLLTACLALVPFVGAAAVWVPCSLYLYFVEGNMVAAIGLAIYGAAVVSMADNVIKPLVLHGETNLHPLVALLSVLGGVTALGPIGILIGPMIVAFLQTLLKILQRELLQMDSDSTAAEAAT